MRTHYALCTMPPVPVLTYPLRPFTPPVLCSGCWTFDPNSSFGETPGMARRAFLVFWAPLPLLANVALRQPCNALPPGMQKRIEQMFYTGSIAYPVSSRQISRIGISPQFIRVSGARIWDIGCVGRYWGCSSPRTRYRVRGRGRGRAGALDTRRGARPSPRTRYRVWGRGRGRAGALDARRGARAGRISRPAPPRSGGRAARGQRVWARWVCRRGAVR